MQSSCWESKKLSRVLAWKTRKGNGNAVLSWDQPHEKVQTKEAEVKEQWRWNLDGQSHTLHLFTLTWIAVISQSSVVVGFLTLGCRQYMLKVLECWC
jgi:hypothetical protein